MTTAAQTTTDRTTAWVVDAEHTTVAFTVRHMMFTTVKGHFAAVQGEVRLDESAPERSRVRVRIPAASIDTRVEARDGHLRSADFLDVERYPELTFESRRIEPARDGAYRVMGDLTIRGVTKEVVLEMREEGRGMDPFGNEKLGYTGETRIDRTDFGLTWNQALEAGGVLVGNEVRITLDVQLMPVA